MIRYIELIIIRASYPLITQGNIPHRERRHTSGLFFLRCCLKLYRSRRAVGKTCWQRDSFQPGHIPDNRIDAAGSVVRPGGAGLCVRVCVDVCSCYCLCVRRCGQYNVLREYVDGPNRQDRQDRTGQAGQYRLSLRYKKTGLDQKKLPILYYHTPNPYI